MSDDSEQKVYIGSDGELSDDFETESIADILSSQDDKEKSKQKPKNTLNRQINKNLIVLFSLIFVVGMLFLNNFLKSTKSDNNDNWVPVIQEFDGVEMVLVPAGCFEMGNGDYSNERPVSKQCFDESFWIDRYEVTNEQYGSYGCREYSSQPDQPRNCVDWFDARDFCEKLGGRLPSEAEWEYAARGPDNLKYPWGNDFVADNVAYNVNSPSETANVGSYPDGMSWVGAYDLSGNLLE